MLRADEDRDMVERGAVPLRGLDLVADPAGFFGPVPHPQHAHLFAYVEFGPQRLAEPTAVMRDHARCGAEDVGRRPVILFEADHLGAGKILLELQDVFDLCAAPRIDGLIIVADAGDVLACLGEQPQPQILDDVGVLIFVHHDVFEAFLIRPQHIGMRLQDGEHVEQQVAEVAGVHRSLSPASISAGTRPLFFQSSIRPARLRAGKRFSSMSAATINCLSSRN
ncbi:hypothetical protein WR25_11663 [Diploscapter pachys]|uniref:Uncharacterized protein n=1 Tax=Diploscapter pachys TaxID=2018661 RepID=A0A2A2KDR7_9BILA|nr:hypothetical protein WR25_11663 [Diploscapter pachys]